MPHNIFTSLKISLKNHPHVFFSQLPDSEGPLFSVALSPNNLCNSLCIELSLTLPSFDLPESFFFFLFTLWLCCRACSILALQPGIKSTSPALEGRVSTTGLLEKSCYQKTSSIPCFFYLFILHSCLKWRHETEGWEAGLPGGNEHEGKNMWFGG